MVETYLQRRGIAHVHHGGSLRFHPRCYYRPDEHLPTETWPAMIACVTDLDGRITGVHRTWLDPDGFDRVRLGKAPIDTPRRAMGDLLGNAVRFGVARRRARRRRRHRDHAVATLRAADLADGRCAVGQSPLQPWLLPSEPASALYRPRRRCRRRCGAGSSDRSARKPPASKRSRCRLGWATSTKICTSSASMPSEQRCGFSSHRRTSPASCIRRR